MGITRANSRAEQVCPGCVRGVPFALLSIFGVFMSIPFRADYDLSGSQPKIYRGVFVGQKDPRIIENPLGFIQIL